MRLRFDRQLEMLHDALKEMAGVVQHAIADASRALIEKDAELARRIIASDDDIDAREKEIENLCLKLILQQQPVASDLRWVSSVLKLITDLERIGDHASDISEINLALADRTYIKKLEHIPQMAEATRGMVADSIRAFVDKDADLARAVIAKDDAVDELFAQVKNELIALINDGADNGDCAFDLIMVAKYFERIGDHATNVAEWAIFSMTGIHKTSRII